MKHFIITIENHIDSEFASETCIESSKKVGNNFNIDIRKAIVPEQVNSLLIKENIQWTYPDIHKIDFKSGLTLHPYVTKNKNARIACGLSHYLLWKECAESNEPYLILEHDSMFIKKLNYDYILDSKYDIIGINDPRHATRKSNIFYSKIIDSKVDILPPPKVDDMAVPQGLAGNSAYIIKPTGAQKVINAVKDYGLWPNDAIMCQQLIKGMGVTRNFYTKVQNMASSTTRD
jgi:GR25 family glycosyltransferase involved in LPS biosynthesis